MTTRERQHTNGLHPPQQPISLLSRAGRAAMAAAADQSATTLGDPAIAALLQQAARQGDGVRGLLDRLAQDLAAGNVAAASACLQQALEPARQMDAAHDRFLAAYGAAQTALAAAQVVLADRRMAQQFPDPAALRQLQDAAQGAAAALDDLALCAEGWAAVLEGTG